MSNNPREKKVHVVGGGREGKREREREGGGGGGGREVAVKMLTNLHDVCKCKSGISCKGNQLHVKGTAQH